MRILSDFHHADLYESLCMLFEDRMGAELYMPIGMEWFEQEIWLHERTFHGNAIAHQYLDRWGSDKNCGDHWERDDPGHPGRIYKQVTLEQFKAQKWDIVLATLMANEAGLYRVSREVGAKFGVQLGNQDAPCRYDLAEFAMFSTTRRTYPTCPYVTYHQEFSLKDFYFQWPPTIPNSVGTWIQVLPASSQEFGRFCTLAEMTPELSWKIHGHSCQDLKYWESNVTTTPELAAQMRAYRIATQFKTWSDGYGHVIHNLFAVGKPTLATATYYKDKLAGPLFVDGVTSFDVQTRTNEEAVEILRRLARDDEFHYKISSAAAARFKEVVNFDADAELVKNMLEKVLA